MQPVHRPTTRRSPTRSACAIVLALVLALPASAGGALAKDGGLVRVDPPIDLGTAPGTTFEVWFEPFQVIEGGTELAWTGTPFVVRLFPVDDAADMSRARATERPAGSGRYVATVTVPASGLARVEIGLVGESCVNGACTISDLPFALTEGSVVGAPPDPAPEAVDAVAQANEAPAVPAVDLTAPPVLPMGVLALVLGLGVVATAFVIRRLRLVPRSRPPTPGR